MTQKSDSFREDNLSGERIELRYVPLRNVMLWANNPKQHDTGLLIQMFEKYGFTDPGKWDSNINGGEGGIVFGNGRTAALIEMYNSGYDPPRGIAVDDDGEWYLPVKFGVDSDSTEQAEAFAIDHNNALLSGGAMGLYDFAKVYDEDKLLRVLSVQDQNDYMPLTFDKEDLSALLYMQDPDPLPDSALGDGDGGGDDDDEGVKQGDRELEGKMPSICGTVEPELYDVYLKVTQEFGETHTDRLEGLLRQYQAVLSKREEFD